MHKLVSFAFVICATNAFSQTLLSPENAIDLALQSNYNIQIARNQQEIVINNTAPGEAGFYPSLGLTSSASVQNNNLNQRFSSGLEVKRNNVGASALNMNLGLTWTLFDGGRMFIAWDRLKEQRRAGELSLRQQMELTVTEVLNAYFDVVRIKQQLEASRFGLDIAEQQVVIANTRLTVGSGSRQQLLQANVDRNTWKSEIIRQRTALENAKNYLNRILARDLATEFDVIDTIPVHQELSLPMLSKTALDKNASLLFAQSNETISRFIAREYKASRFPVLAATGGYNFTRSASEGGFSLFNQSQGPYAGLALNWNLFNGGMLNRQIQSAELIAQNYSIQRKDVEQSVSFEVLQAWRDLENARELMELEEENFEVARENLKLAQDRFRLGASDILVVKEAQRSYQEAITRLTEIRYSAKRAENELLRLSGQILK